MKPLVTFERGGQREAEQEFTAIAVDSQTGTVLNVVGDRELVTTWRSAAKPFQLEVTAGTLGSERIRNLPPRAFAIGAASHTGEPEHVRLVSGLLAEFGRTEQDLFCGAHWPTHEASRVAFCAAGATAPSVLQNNCSGKHTFMAASCAVKGWEPDYRPKSHPLQQAILSRLGERLGNPGQVAGQVVDGCGVPCFVLRLESMARLWSQLAAEMAHAAPSLL